MKLASLVPAFLARLLKRVSTMMEYFREINQRLDNSEIAAGRLRRLTEEIHDIKDRMHGLRERVEALEKEANRQKMPDAWLAELGDLAVRLEGLGRKK